MNNLFSKSTGLSANVTFPMNMQNQFWKRLLTVTLFCFAGQFLHAACAADNDQSLPRTILEKADQIRSPNEGFQVDVKINTSTSGQAREERKYRILSKGNENTVVIVIEPSIHRGQNML